MSVPELLEAIQNAGVSRAISESTWGYPVVGAVHVLAIALFGGAVLVTNLRGLGLKRDVRWLKLLGLALMISTGALLFASGAVRYYSSGAFRMKMALLGLLLLNSLAASRCRTLALHSAIALALWAAVIFASRGIAFF